MTLKELETHCKSCILTSPPGNEIYRDTEKKISVFEINGSNNETYSENLCYLAKLFLDHKTLIYDCKVFIFIVTCYYDEYGHHIIGYFSREKYSIDGWNLNCIMTSKMSYLKIKHYLVILGQFFVRNVF